jgi:hypothetical protein
MLATVLAMALSSTSLSAPETSSWCDSCRLVANASSASGLEVRRQELRRRIDDINLDTRSMKTDFPVGSLVLAYLGYSFAPLLLIGIPVILVSPLIGGAALAIGIALTAVGVGGVVALVAGLTSGFKAQEELRARRDALVNERLRLEDELKSLSSPTGGTSPQVRGLTMTLFTFS